MEQVRETAGSTVRTIIRYARERGGDVAVARMLALSGAAELPEAYEDPRRRWPRAFRIRLFEAAAVVFADDDVATRIGVRILDHTVGTSLRLSLSLVGGPGRLFRLVGKAGRRFDTCGELTAEVVRRGRAVLSYRQQRGHQANLHDCNYTRGLLSQIPAVFRLPPATVRHDRCQVRGDAECVYELTWRPRPRLGALHRLVRRRGGRGELAGVMTSQLAELQKTVAEVVGARDTERMLTTLAERAAYAVDAHAFLLVVRTADRGDKAYGFGLSEEELAARTTAGRPDADAGTLVVDIASPTRTYGYLAAFGEDGFLDAERELLDAYAGLAAVALDALTAIDAAAERQRTAESLLALSEALPRASSDLEVATVTTSAVRAVMHADVAAVLLFDDQRRLRMAAHAGWPATWAHRLDSVAIAPSEAPALFEARRAHPDCAAFYDDTTDDPLLRRLLHDFGMRRMSVVGIALPDRLFGVLVAGFHDPQGAERSARFVARMAGVARQAATVLRSRELLDETWQLAHVDPLTGLANRRAFMAELSGAVDAGPGALVFLDLDGFKQVNDTHGHGAGDELLSVVAARLATCVRGGDTVARLGGDEFVVLVRGLTDHRAVDELTARLRDALAQPIGLSMARVTARASVGVTLFDRGEPAEAVLHRADAAMYARKRQRRTLSPTAA